MENIADPEWTDGVVEDVKEFEFIRRDVALLRSGAMTDATICCGPRKWRAHKVILARCDYVREAFAEGTEAGATGMIRLSPGNAWKIDVLLQYTYAHGLYTQGSYSLVACVQLGFLGVEYRIPEMEELASTKMKECRYGKIDDLLDAIDLAWTGPNHSNEVQNALLDIVPQLGHRISRTPSTRIFDIMDKFPDFARRVTLLFNDSGNNSEVPTSA